METLRKPFQGITNIVRFNWHFYLIVLMILITTSILSFFLDDFFKPFLLIFIILFLIIVLSSLAVSYYVYDATGFYHLKWIKIEDSKPSKILNINAGFDETSDLLRKKFLNSEVVSVDFYDEKFHTEISIKRARNLYPNSAETIAVKTDNLPFKTTSVDFVFLIFAAHEIRDNPERIIFFKELNRILKTDGKIIITEHLRDFNNFMAFNIGFFHFLPLQFWKNTFTKSGFVISEKSKINPFVTSFYLNKNGTST